MKISATRARRSLRICGLAASFVALVWIAVRFAHSGALDLLANVPATTSVFVATLLAAAVAYALIMSFVAFAWWRLIAALSPTQPPARPMMALFAVTQYGKYLPGNVAHYALRHTWARRYGLSHAGLALSSILEAALLLLAALSLVIGADTRRLAVLAAILIALGFFLRRARQTRLLHRLHLPELPPLRVLAVCFACYVVFLAASAAILDFLAHPLGIRVDSFAMLLAASAASWLAGFVVIGAPGGLGVREAAFVALAGGALGESQALLLIGLFRIVTFFGDTLFFAAGAAVLRATPREGDPQPSSKT
jgi:uncharacterized membrane protein YbhN (UPF0104 family)